MSIKSDKDKIHFESKQSDSKIRNNSSENSLHSILSVDSTSKSCDSLIDELQKCDTKDDDYNSTQNTDQLNKNPTDSIDDKLFKSVGNSKNKNNLARRKREIESEYSKSPSINSFMEKMIDFRLSPNNMSQFKESNDEKN
tara:strand:+ start:885 stop:1304 length:420 start_codon:yes stop_codon:yes gene_type:complete